MNALRFGGSCSFHRLGPIAAPQALSRTFITMRLVTPTSLSTTLIVLSLWSSKPVAASIIPSKRTPSLIQHENAFVFAGDITLSAEATSPEVLILDFGQNMEGFPTFEVASTLGDTSKFEITFAESKDALGQYMVRAVQEASAMTSLN